MWGDAFVRVTRLSRRNMDTAGVSHHLGGERNLLRLYAGRTGSEGTFLAHCLGWVALLLVLSGGGLADLTQTLAYAGYPFCLCSSHHSARIGHNFACPVTPRAIGKPYR